MKPKIVVLTGALKGTVCTIDGNLSVGRDETNSLALNDKMMSRHHCCIKGEKGLYKVCDLDSHNGTLINGIPIKEQSLRHGDRIQVGSNVLLFLLYEENDLTLTDEVEFYDTKPLQVSAVSLSLESAVYSLARDLNFLFKVSQIINTAGSLRDFQCQLLTALFQTTPAERGTIILCDAGLDNIQSAFTLGKEAAAGRPPHMSRTVAAQVLNDKVPVLSSNIMESDSLSRSESLMAANVRSLLCAPLLLRKRAIGIIYLETSDAEARFDEGHLQTLTAITGLVSGPLDNLRQLDWLEGENRRLKDDIQIEHNLVGESAPMREIYQFIAKVAPADTTIMIRGESGTGKELVARAIHQNSPRSAKPFVAVNCAALSEALIESELFGHEKGAFTGAYMQKKGKFEIADGGTIFLDEVSEMPLQAQAKLLRILQEREFERVGGTRLIKVNVRVIAATNKPLEEAVCAGEFRQDLYYRLNVISRTMPPLRERREDIPLLAGYFAVKYGERCKRRVMGVSAEALDCLKAHDWPGNVRELENAVECAIVIGSAERIQPEDLPEHVLEAYSQLGSSAMNYHDALREAKRQLVARAIEQAGGNHAEAAKTLGIHPNNLHRLRRNLGLK